MELKKIYEEDTEKLVAIHIYPNDLPKRINNVFTFGVISGIIIQFMIIPLIFHGIIGEISSIILFAVGFFLVLSIGGISIDNNDIVENIQSEELQLIKSNLRRHDYCCEIINLPGSKKGYLYVKTARTCSSLQSRKVTRLP